MTFFEIIDDNVTNIKHTKGDTLIAKVNPKLPDGTAYVPQVGDVIRFALKRSYDNRTVLIRQDIPTNTMILRIESDVTKTLDIRDDGYVYDIQITFADGTVKTFIRGKLYLTKEVD